MEFNRTIILQVVRYTVSLILLLIIWEMTIRLLHIQPYLLPHSGTVFSTLLTEHARFIQAAEFTVRNAIVGATIGVVGGIITAALLAGIPVVRWICEPYLTIFQSFPREALLPLLMTWLGLGPALKVTSAAMLCFFPTTMVVLAALVNVRSDYLILLRSWGASELQILLHLRLPSAIPAIIASIKLAVPISLIGSVLGEFMGGNEGVGYIIINSGAQFRVDRIFAGIVILCFLGVIGAAIINLLQLKLFGRFYHEP